MRRIIGIMGVGIIVSGCASFFGSVRSQAPTEDAVQTVVRLPDTAVPLAYSLSLDVDPTQPSFSGRAMISIRLTQPTKTLVLHGRGLRVSSTVVQAALGQRFQATYAQTVADGTSEITFPRVLGPQVIRLEMEYTADFDTNLRGLYRVEVDGHWYAFTQFEPLDARGVFPSFDEPRFKVPMTVRLNTPNDVTALANTPSRSRKVTGPESVSWRFEATPPLPTYLLAVAVGPFDVVELPGGIPASHVRAQSIPLRGVAVKGRGKDLAYALKHTPALMGLFETYFGQPYPYRKLDIVAVPDFSSGAMENVGLVTFREWLLLVDGENAPVNQRRAFASVMAHELAHQWFGNLVTMPWWDDLWLNEAFATWMGNKVVDMWRPAYASRQGLQAYAQRAMTRDSQVHARQIRQPIRTTGDIHNAFDGITYAKGGAVLSMFESFLGEEVFRDGVRRYLAAHANSTATADDFVTALSAAANKDLQGAFASFLAQPGLPLLTVETGCSADGALSLGVQQSRFLPVGSAGNRDVTWELPVCVRTQSGKAAPESHCQWIRDAKETVTLAASCDATVLPNADGAGYFRVAGDDAFWARVEGGLGHATPREALAIVDSLMAQLESPGGAPVSALMQRLAKLVATRTERRVVTAPVRVLRRMRDDALSDAQLPAFQGFVADMYRPVYDRLGGLGDLAGSTEDEVLLRRDVVSVLAFVARDPEVRAALATAGRAYLGMDGARDPKAVDANLAGLALRVTAEEGGLDVVQRLHTRLETERDAVWRYALVQSLGATLDPDAQAWARGQALAGTLRTNELSTFVLWHQTWPRRQTAWQWIQANPEQIFKALPKGHRSRVLEGLGGLCHAGAEASVSALAEPLLASIPGGDRSLNVARERIALCRAWLGARQSDVDAFVAGL